MAEWRGSLVRDMHRQQGRIFACILLIALNALEFLKQARMRVGERGQIGGSPYLRTREVLTICPC